MHGRSRASTGGQRGWLHRGAGGLVGALLLALALAGGPAARPPQARAAGRCTGGCYAAKSQAYQRCRNIPAAQRVARTACFRRADGELARCLRRCPAAEP